LKRRKIEAHVVREREQLNADIQTKTHEANLNAAFQEKELMARKEKELREYEIDVATLRLKERELDWKIGESDKKLNLDAVKFTDQMDVQMDVAELQSETQRYSVDKQSQNRSPEQGSGSSTE
jgi:hypothetical protein